MTRIRRYIDPTDLPIIISILYTSFRLTCVDGYDLKHYIDFYWSYSLSWIVITVALNRVLIIGLIVKLFKVLVETLVICYFVVSATEFFVWVIKIIIESNFCEGC